VWLTLFGHSYGSTTSSIAATLTAPGTLDNLILTGSPGTGVMDASQWNVPAGQVYVSAATPRWVPVQTITGGAYPDPESGEMIYPGPSTYYAFDRDDAVNFGVHADRVGAVVVGVLGGPVGAVWAGQIWSDPPFGHVVTDMDGVTQLSGDTGVPSEDLAGISQVALHGSYPNYSNEENKTPSGSLTDITRVVVGQYHGG